MLSNSGAREDFWESFGLQGDKPVHPKGNQSWIFNGRTDAEAEAPILRPPDVKIWLTRKDPDAGKDWRREEKVRGWDGCMASPTQWTWVWANSWSWWWTEKPGVLQSMGLQGVGHDWTVYLFYGQQFLFLNLILLICSSLTLPFSNHNFVFYVRRCSSDPNIGLGFGVLFAFLLKHMSLTRLWDIVT